MIELVLTTQVVGAFDIWRAYPTMCVRVSVCVLAIRLIEIRQVYSSALRILMRVDRRCAPCRFQDTHARMHTLVTHFGIALLDGVISGTTWYRGSHDTKRRTDESVGECVSARWKG